MVSQIYFDSTDAIEIVLCGAEAADNPVRVNGKVMKNIRRLNFMKPANWELAKSVDQEIETTNYNADWVNALTVALDVLHQQLESGVVYEKTQILVLSTLKSSIQQPSKQIESAYVNAMKENGTEIYFVGSNVTNDDEDDGVKEENVELNDSELFAKRFVNQVKIYPAVYTHQAYISVILKL